MEVSTVAAKSTSEVSGAVIYGAVRRDIGDAEWPLCEFYDSRLRRRPFAPWNVDGERAFLGDPPPRRRKHSDGPHENGPVNTRYCLAYGLSPRPRFFGNRGRDGLAVGSPASMILFLRVQTFGHRAEEGVYNDTSVIFCIRDTHRTLRTFSRLRARTWWKKKRGKTLVFSTSKSDDVKTRLYGSKRQPAYPLIRVQDLAKAASVETATGRRCV